MAGCFGFAFLVLVALDLLWSTRLSLSPPPHVMRKCVGGVALLCLTPGLFLFIASQDLATGTLWNVCGRLPRMRDKDFRAPWSQRECHQIELDANFTKDMELDTNGTKEEEEAVHVFYHIFAKAHASLPSALVSEQLATLAEAHCKRPLYINYVLVGQAWNSRAISESGLNCSRCHKAAEIPVGNEIFTLQLLHDHCRKNPATLAAYIHDKGSFHPSGPNTVLRRFLTTSVASRECLGLPETCTVCSGRFSPLPHPHYPGNMWTARCSYIEKLMPPLGFEAAMKKFVLQHLSASPMGGLRQNGDNELLGAGRFAAEHWMTSHPSVVPCDVYPGAYDWGYYHIAEDMVKGCGCRSCTLARGSRFKATVTVVGWCQ